MIRLRRDDFENPEAVAAFAEHRRDLDSDQFKREFESIVADERPPLII